MKDTKKQLILAIIFTVLAVAINAYIIVHSCLDAIQSNEASKGVVEVSEDIVNTVAPGTITPANHDSFAVFIRKAFGHFGLFMISGLLTSISLYLWLHRHKWAKHFLMAIIGLSFGLLLGVITEVIQLSVPGRTGDFKDVLIDFTGYILGSVIISFIILLIHIHRRKKEKVSQ